MNTNETQYEVFGRKNAGKTVLLGERYSPYIAEEREPFEGIVVGYLSTCVLVEPIDDRLKGFGIALAPDNKAITISVDRTVKVFVLTNLEGITIIDDYKPPKPYPSYCPFCRRPARKNKFVICSNKKCKVNAAYKKLFHNYKLPPKIYKTEVEKFAYEHAGEMITATSFDSQQFEGRLVGYHPEYDSLLVEYDLGWDWAPRKKGGEQMEFSVPDPGVRLWSVDLHTITVKDAR